jgi:sec-independent protein translocase protein TatA
MSYNAGNLIVEKTMFSMPSGMELGIIVLVILLLFGGKKIPELAKGLGSGIKNFKNAIKEDDDPTKVVVNEVKDTTTKA